MDGFKEITPEFIETLLAKARTSPRLRSHHNFHEGPDSPIQRLCIGLCPGTYVRPHQHPQSNKWESIIILFGKICVLCFDDEGIVTKRTHLGVDSMFSKGLELPAAYWHMLFPLEGEALILEFKEGPFGEKAPVNFAPWAPEEGNPSAKQLLDWALHAPQGDKFPTS